MAARAASPTTVFAGRYPRATFEHVFVYDRLGRLDYELDDVQLDLAEKAGIPLSQITVKLDYDYDSAGNRTRIVDRNGRVRTFAYDERNRLILEQWFADTADTTPDRSFATTYCTCGAVEEAVEYAAEPLTSEILSQYVYTHDVLNRVTSVDNAGTKDMPHVVLSYGYDANGNRISVTDNLGVTLKSTYDNRNRLDKRWWENTTAAHAVDEALLDFDYYRTLREKELKRFSDKLATTLVGRTLYAAPDAAGRIQTISHRNAADDVLAEYAYGFDELGLIDNLRYDRLGASESQYDFEVAYRYDDLGQLTDADYSDATNARGIYGDELYRYDKNGNRVQSHLHGNGYVTGTGNRLLSDGTFDYAYDNEGSMVRKTDRAAGEVTVFEYDHRNRMTRATQYSRAPEDGGIILGESTNRYDLDGRRIAFRNDDDGAGPNPAVETRVIHNGDDTWADFDTANQVAARYMLGERIDQMIARYVSQASDSQALGWYVADALGTIRDVFTSRNVPVVHNSYQSFGQPYPPFTVGVTERFGFTGREIDTRTHMYFYRSRFYSPMSGMFTQPDTLSFRASDVNLYRFVANNPVNMLDPFGTTSIIGESLLRGVRAAAGAGLGALFGGAAGGFLGTAAVLGCETIANPQLVTPIEDFIGRHHASLFDAFLDAGVRLGTAVGLIYGAGGTLIPPTLVQAGLLYGGFYIAFARFLVQDAYPSCAAIINDG